MTVMTMLFGGVGLIVVMMVTTMATPFIYYLKRDNAWLASDRSVASWHAPQ